MSERKPIEVLQILHDHIKMHDIPVGSGMWEMIKDTLADKTQYNQSSSVEKQKKSDKDDNFTSVKEFVTWLIDNEGKILVDNYGRQWKYENYAFKFKDIGTNDVFNDGLKCVHLFSTVIHYRT